MAERPSELGDITELMELIDRLEPLLARSGLSEIEIEAGDTTIILRAPSAVGAVTPASAAMLAVEPVPVGAGVPAAADAAGSGAPGSGASGSGLRSIVAPLTGVFYRSPSPGAADYVRVGGEVSEGQVIGLLEAMKLFNEIKSDVTGIVRRIAAESGALVKTRQTLIEIEPT